MPKGKRNRDTVRLDELILPVQNKDQKAITEFIELLSPYLKKYVSIIKGAKVTLNNKDTYRFYSLFLSNREKDPINIGMVQRMFVRFGARYDSDELYNEFVAIALQLTKKYRKVKGVNFLNYFTQVFRFRLKDWFNNQIKNPLNTYIELTPYLEDTSPEFFSSEEEPNILWDLNWLLNPKDQLFSKLTSYQRFLIFMSIAKGTAIEDMAVILKRDKDTVWRHLKIAKELINTQEDVFFVRQEQGDTG